jgi:hypothetical protein
MRQYTRPPVIKEDVNLLAKELDFCFDQKGSMYFLTKYCEELGKSGVWHNSKSLEEIYGFLFGFKYGFRYSKKTCSYCRIDYKKAVAYDKEVGI